MATNLLEKITKEDKELMTKYMELYATDFGLACDIDKYLANWSASKSKLFHLLGDQLMIKFPYESEMTLETMEHTYRAKLEYKTHDILRRFANLFELQWELFFNSMGDSDIIKYDVIGSLYSSKIWVANEMRLPERYGNVCKVILKNGKTLSINSKMKPVKVLLKVYETLKTVPLTDAESVRLDTLAKAIEEFRIAHSNWVGEKLLRGNLVFSIHPMDFMTMSDNASDWQSCMSWRAEGCYRVGTVEMMNSNNVICAYLESTSSQYTFKYLDEKLSWNNKKYRQLFYITKDIILGGESYPYTNNAITKYALNILRKLANKNLHWRYKFGPELYTDMKDINDFQCIDAFRSKIRYGYGKPTKKIVFDTNGMYNDLMYKNHDLYCIRNEVKKGKIISASGKTACACCGNNDILIPRYYDMDDLTEDDYYDIEDNGKYENTRDLVCHDCRDSHTCHCCDRFISDDRRLVFPEFSDNDYDFRCCEKCLKEIALTTCPFCEKQCHEDSYCGKGYIAIKTEFFNESTLISNWGRLENDQHYMFDRDKYGTFEEYYDTVKPELLLLHCCCRCWDDTITKTSSEKHDIWINKYGCSTLRTFFANEKTLTKEEISKQIGFDSMYFTFNNRKVGK